ncbi:hypothetical protein B0T20DRAFT_79322 [Sordaria brevicollis]|uniref:Uncharacterized protein n=1 Tax=Sordaria brevicollis TaxID=83679 RepID=A0AAE0P1C1_SORBR|nr:hypothetical protein B0T20DRAFT_79322 [Sordaria brevicollis]
MINVHSARGQNQNILDITVGMGTWEYDLPFPCLQATAAGTKSYPHPWQDRPPFLSLSLATILHIAVTVTVTVCMGRSSAGHAHTALYGTVQPQRLGSPALPTRARSGYDRRQSVASELRRKAKRGKEPRGGRECTGTLNALHDEPLVIKRWEPEFCARCRNNTSTWRTCPLALPSLNYILHYSSVPTCRPPCLDLRCTALQTLLPVSHFTPARWTGGSEGINRTGIFRVHLCVGGGLHSVLSATCRR